MPRETPTGDFVLPDWIDPEVWAEFEKHRKKIRKPMTDYAKRLIIRRLIDFRSHSDPNECLNASIRSGWTDVYPKSQRDRPNGGDAPKGWEGLKKFSERNSK